MEVRTRFAPSPTGYMHIGNLRTALYTFLIAKSLGGKFILRIEDTDQERYVPGAIEVIYKTLRENGLVWDEGPDIGGDFGPYIQSERKEIYIKYAEELVDRGDAYYCFCDRERLDSVRSACVVNKVPPKYDGFCRNLSDKEISEKLSEGVPYVIRQKMPLTGTSSFDDLVFGRLVVENSTLDDNVLIKSDGLPTYNFANVVDDHLMGITHVVRGSEYLSSTPKYNLLYKAFGWDIPAYVHVSPVMKDHNKKLSKRDGDASYEDFVSKGYLPEALLNYIALLGWNPGTQREKFSLDELVHTFKLDGISKSPAIFDENKLLWLNGEYIKDMSDEEFFEKSEKYLLSSISNPAINIREVSDLIKSRTERFSDIPGQIDFFEKLPEYSPDLFEHKKMKTTIESARSVLQDVCEAFLGMDSFTLADIKEVFAYLVKKLDIKNGQLMYPVRVALSGKEFTPGGAAEIAAILGKNESIQRIRKGISLLS